MLIICSHAQDCNSKHCRHLHPHEGEPELSECMDIDFCDHMDMDVCCLPVKQIREKEIPTNPNAIFKRVHSKKPERLTHEESLRKWFPPLGESQ